MQTRDRRDCKNFLFWKKNIQRKNKEKLESEILLKYQNEKS